MLIADVEKTMERLSGSEWLRYTMMLSTAKWPEADIHYWYKLCTQLRFHTKCECENGIILDDHFPTSQSSNVRLPFKEVDGTVEYWCPECDTVIEDSQIGEWIPDNPDARYRSIHFPQTLSATVSAQKVMEKYYAAQDMQNFFNRVLGKPHANPDHQIPINMGILRECERLGVQRGLEWKKSGKGFYMGIDNMGGFSCVVIIERLEDNTMAFVHAEAVYGLNPWDRLDELMMQYGISICVVEHLPNYDSVKTFAARWPGRVYMINSYGDEMLVWKDVNQSKGKKKTETELRNRYAVSINQYKMMDWALSRMVKHKCLFPKVDELTQTVSKGMDTFQNITALGTIVVIASGNQPVPLDDPSFGGLFDINIRDSGAIVTGVSFSDLAPISNSYPWGSRIDAFTPGELESLGTNNNYIVFSQNSATTPAVAGAVAAIQSIAKGVYGITLTAREMRNIIRTEGTPQSAELNHLIGWLPNILKAGQVGIPRIIAIRLERAAALVLPNFLLLND